MLEGTCSPNPYMQGVSRICNVCYSTYWYLENFVLRWKIWAQCFFFYLLGEMKYVHGTIAPYRTIREFHTVPYRTLRPASHQNRDMLTAWQQMKSFSQGSRHAIAYPHILITLYSLVIIVRSYSPINLVSKTYATGRMPEQQDVYARSLYKASLL